MQLDLLADWEDTRFDQSDDQLVAGVDEVGRGSLFGPVVAAAVLLPQATFQVLAEAGVQDSKRLSAQRRPALAQLIQATALDWAVGVASVVEIDRINILQASLLAMKRAVDSLHPAPQLCLIDGNQSVPDLGIPQQTWIKGDQRSLAIASASIVAKVWRDRLIVDLAEQYPQYDLARNKGYGSPAHRQALQQHGASDQHRRSFKTCRELG